MIALFLEEGCGAYDHQECHEDVLYVSPRPSQSRLLLEIVLEGGRGEGVGMCMMGGYVLWVCVHGQILRCLP